MPFQKWKSPLEIIKNSFYRKFILIIILLTFCKTPIYKEINCTNENSIKYIIDSIEISPNQWILLSLNPLERDYKNEIINHSSLLFLEYKDSNIITKEIKIINRDDYPLKPISITFDKSSNTIFLLNIAFHKQRAIEIYEFKNFEFYYKKRFRSDNFKDLISLMFYNQKLIGLNYNDVFYSKNDIIIKDTKTFHYKNFGIKKGLKIKLIQNTIFIFIPKEKKILLLDQNFQLQEIYKFDFHPIDMYYYNHNYYILLNKNFINYINDITNSDDLLKHNESYIYKLSEEVMKQYRYFNIKKNLFEKFKLPMNSFYNNFMYFFGTKQNEMILNQFHSDSKKCNIDIDFFK